MSSRNPDVVVVGTGAVGCAVAYQLTKRGLSVTLIGRNGIARDASGKAWGGLTAHFGAGVPGQMLERYRKSTQMHVELYEELKPDPPDRSDWNLRPVSTITLALNDSELSELRESADWKRNNGFNAEVIDGDGAREIEPAMTQDAIGAMLTNTEWEIDCVRYAVALANFARGAGCEGIDAEAIAVESHQNGVTVSTNSGEKRSAISVVVATGPWVDSVQGIPALPVRPVKGEILRVNRPGNDLQTRVSYAGRNVGRKPNGLVWLGTYEQDVGYDDSITDEGRDLILSGVFRYLPGIESSAIRAQTACLRPASADGLPIVGNVGDGVIVANGAGKKGILLSLWIAQAVADLIVNGSEVPPDLSPSRFGIG